MSFYELNAEKSGYFRLGIRTPYVTPTHFHSATEMIFVESGEQTLVIGAQRRTLKAGEGAFVESFVPHFYEKPEGTVYYLVAEDKYFDRAFDEKRILPRFFSFDNFAFLSQMYSFSKKEYKYPQNKALALEGTLKILISAISEENDYLEIKKDKPGELVREILKYAYTSLNDDLSLNALSRRYGYSADYLSRLLRKQLSENFGEYVNRLRVRYANELLRTKPEMSVLQIAFDSGFDSIHTFYRAYKKEFDRLPRRNK